MRSPSALFVPVVPWFALACLAAVGCSGGDGPGTSPTDSAPTDTGEEAADDAPPACDAVVSKGPWVVAVDGTSAKVRWESCRAGGGGLSYQPAAGGAATKAASTVRSAKVTTWNDVPLIRSADYPGTFFMHEVALTGLAEGTCYTYAIDAEPGATGRLCTAKKAGEAFTFASIGDTNLALNDLSKMLGEAFTKGQPELTLHGGDIQYYSSGVETYGVWFDKARPFLRSGAFFPAIGNHEFEKPLEREEYIDRFWGNPGFDGDGDRYRVGWAGVWFFALNTEQPIGADSAQGKWLEGKLADAKAKPGYRFSVVWMHRPLVSCGDGGHKDAERKTLLPIFTANGVKLVIQAHMHGYERFEMDGITWVTSGGGGGLLGNVDKELAAGLPECASRKASGKWYNATLYAVPAGPGKLTGKTIATDGDVRDTFEIAVP